MTSEVLSVCWVAGSDLHSQDQKRKRGGGRWTYAVLHTTYCTCTRWASCHFLFLQGFSDLHFDSDRPGSLLARLPLAELCWCRDLEIGKEDPSHPSQSGCSHLARYDLLLVLDREAKNRLAEKDHCKWRRRPVHSTTCQRLASVQVRHEMYRCCCRCVLLHALSNTHEHDGVPAERPEVVLTLAKNQAVNMQVRLFFRPWCAGTAGPQFCILQMQCAPGPRRLFCFGVACTVHFAVSGWTLSRFRPILEPLCLAYLHREVSCSLD